MLLLTRDQVVPLRLGECTPLPGPVEDGMDSFRPLLVTERRSRTVAS